MTINNGGEIIQSGTCFLPIYLTRAHTHKPGHHQVRYMYDLSQTYRFAFIHCFLPPLGDDKHSGEQKAAPVEGTDQSPPAALPTARSVCFSLFLFLPPLLKSETAVNY